MRNIIDNGTIKIVNRYNYSNVEIEVFFSRYDVDGKFTYNPEDEENGEKPSLAGFKILERTSRSNH